MKRCASCGNVVSNKVFIANGRIYCHLHDPNWKPEPATPFDSRTYRWLMYLFAFVFAFALIGVAHAGGLVNEHAVHCEDGVLCKGEDIEIEGSSYICKDPLIAIEIAKVHQDEGAMKAASDWALHEDRGDCLKYEGMGGVVGDLIIGTGPVRVVAFQVDWPKAHVFLLTKMAWKQIII